MSTLRDGLLVHSCKFDAAGRQLESGPSGVTQALLDDLKIKAERQVSVYDINGRITGQRAYKADGALKYDVLYERYDNVGSLVRHRVENHDGTKYTITYTTGHLRRAGYQTDRVAASSNLSSLGPGRPTTGTT